MKSKSLHQIFEKKNTTVCFVLKSVRVPFLGSPCAMHRTSATCCTTRLIASIRVKHISETQNNFRFKDVPLYFYVAGRALYQRGAKTLLVLTPCRRRFVIPALSVSLPGFLLLSWRSKQTHSAGDRSGSCAHLCR
jgi:hypothetical protein